MARPATARRPADGRPGRLDRPARRDLPADPGPSAAAHGPPHPLPPPPVTPDACWALLPAADRERFGLRLSRLVLRAVRTPDPSTEEDA